MRASNILLLYLALIFPLLISFSNSIDPSPNKLVGESDAEFSIRMGLIDLEKNDLNGAAENAETAIKKAKAANDPAILSQAYILQGSVFDKKNQNRKARDSFEAALEAAEKTGDSGLLTTALKQLAQITAAIRKYDEAYAYYQRYADLKESEKLKSIQKQFLTEKEKLLVQKSKVQQQVVELEEESKLTEIRNRQIIDSIQQAKLRTDLELKDQELQLKEQELEISEQKNLRNVLMAVALLASFVVLFVFYNYNNKRKANEELESKNEQIRIEQERSDSLLLNILPKQIAEELKKYGKAEPQHFEHVSVMFSDFKSFTFIAEQMSPQRLVEEIDFCFREFDRIIGKYGIEKIKTIGDAYMCVGGLPMPDKDHPEKIIKASLEIQDFLKRLKEERRAKGEAYFEARIGINTGPVVAGIVGSKKFAYDIWGDTVNTASRIESSGEAGRVNISGSTYELIKDKFKCEFRGKIEVKNKGEIEMYFVNGYA